MYPALHGFDETGEGPCQCECRCSDSYSSRWSRLSCTHRRHAPCGTASTATRRPPAAQALYGQQCASCHGDKLEGVQGPPLTTDVFLGRWQAQPLSDLANKIRNTMPAGSPGSLTPQQAADLVAHLLKVGSFPREQTELASDEAALSRIGWPKGLVAAAAHDGTRPRVSAAREHGAVDARHLLPERESDLHGADTRSCREAASRLQAEVRRVASRSSNGEPGSMADGSSWTTPPLRWLTRRR